MKTKIIAFVTLVVALVGLNKVSAQSSDPFAGKWKVEVTGTPSGDSTGELALERKDGKLTGTFTIKGASSKLSRVEEKKEEITAYFTSSSGYDVYLYLKKNAENAAEGSMMDMFDAKAVREIKP